jgi:hypothetical protein
VTFLPASPRRQAEATDALKERVDYAGVVRKCFGTRSPDASLIVAPPAPAVPAAREAARRQCIADRERLERGCR